MKQFAAFVPRWWEVPTGWTSAHQAFPEPLLCAQLGAENTHRLLRHAKPGEGCKEWKKPIGGKSAGQSHACWYPHQA